ncbi:MAG: hypothetical protein M1833_001533 [Piccolia ochrophora]|nr:MAG: hypothetical protein M1833_001533 [Piccolia ochrophora]
MMLVQSNIQAADFEAKRGPACVDVSQLRSTASSPSMRPTRCTPATPPLQASNRQLRASTQQETKSSRRTTRVDDETRASRSPMIDRSGFANAAHAPPSPLSQTISFTEMADSAADEGAAGESDYPAPLRVSVSSLAKRGNLGVPAEKPSLHLETTGVAISPGNTSSWSAPNSAAPKADQSPCQSFKTARERGFSTSSSRSWILSPGVQNPVRPNPARFEQSPTRLNNVRVPPHSSMFSAHRSEYGQSPRNSNYSLPRSDHFPKGDDYSTHEVRTSLRSALTTNSSFLGDSSGTERSSVWTKSSATSVSTHGHIPCTSTKDEGMTVDEAISMYAEGFTDETEPVEADTHLRRHDDAPFVLPPCLESETDADELQTLGTRPLSSSTTCLEEEEEQEQVHPTVDLALTEPVSKSTVAVDMYGFHKATQHVTTEQHDLWNEGYTEHLARRRKKWMALMKSNGLSSDDPTRFPPRSQKVKRFVRKGIPPEWRGPAWFWYSGAHIQMDRHPHLYEQLLEKAEQGGVSENDQEMIDKDLHRTFPDNIRFKPQTTEAVHPATPANPASLRPETPLLCSLRHVLQAFSIHSPQIGYCQSLNFLAGQLLLFLSEVQAFWLLTIITTTYLPGTHSLNLEGANIDLGVLMACLRDALPATYATLLTTTPNASTNPAITTTASLPPITLCTTAWFMSCFIGTLPTETCLRVWDVFFYEGSKTLFRISLAIFKLVDPVLRVVRDPMELFQVMQTAPRKLLDPNVLMQACYRRRNGFGHLSQSQVDAKRREWRERVQREKLAVKAGNDPDGKVAAPRKMGSSWGSRVRGRSFSRRAPRIRRALTEM